MIDPADIDTREQVDEAFDVLKQSYTSTARAAIQPIRVSDSKQTIGPGVHLLNAHKGKGQQFDWVFVVGLEEGHLPGKRNNQGGALAEERRVFIVMLSRARHGLVVTRVKTEKASMVYITKTRVVGGLTLGLTYHRLKKLSTIFGKMWWRVEIIIDACFR